MIKPFLYKTYYRVKNYQIEKEYFLDTNITIFRVFHLPYYEEVFDKKLKAKLIIEIKEQ